MLIVEEKGIRGKICHAIYKYGKARNKQMKDCDKKKESLYLKNLCLQEVLSGLKIHLNLVKILQKTSMEIVMMGIFLKLMFNILKDYMVWPFHNELPFFHEIMKVEKVETFVPNFFKRK